MFYYSLPLLSFLILLKIQQILFSCKFWRKIFHRQANFSPALPPQGGEAGLKSAFVLQFVADGAVDKFVDGGAGTRGIGGNAGMEFGGHAKIHLGIRRNFGGNMPFPTTFQVKIDSLFEVFAKLVNGIAFVKHSIPVQIQHFSEKAIILRSKFYRT